MKPHKKQIEIEMRAMFDKAKYDELKEFLDSNAEYLGEDDKDVHFYIFSDKLLKVTDNISRKTAKLTLKLNRIGKGSHFEEIEFPIQPEYVDEAVRMFDELNMTDNIMHSFQCRHNYVYKGIELALKCSPEWKHHLELELVIDDIAQKEAAEEKIRDVAKELGVKLMTEEELDAFVTRVEAEKKREREGR